MTFLALILSGGMLLIGQSTTAISIESTSKKPAVVVNKQESSVSIQIEGGKSSCSITDENTLFCTGEGPTTISVNPSGDQSTFHFLESEEFICFINELSGHCSSTSTLRNAPNGN